MGALGGLVKAVTGSGGAQTATVLSLVCLYWLVHWDSVLRNAEFRFQKADSSTWRAFGHAPSR